MIGQTLKGRYEVTARLGRGAMGTVYLADDTQSGKKVALKVITNELASEPAMLERFKREGEALRQLKHPNIVEFIDAFEQDEQYVIVMEYVSGGSLYELLQAGKLPIERATQITLDLCDALIRAHRLNIIHRDIKPDNVLIAEDGTPKLADFGVARLSEGTRMTRSGMQVGTPFYMAPEAWEGKPLDAQADIWSLGVVLFEMLSGQVPFDGDTGPAVMTKVMTTPPPDLKKLRKDVPTGMVTMINRMLAREKDERYKSMRQVAADLEQGEATITPKPAKKQPKPVPPTRIVSPARSFNISKNVKIGGMIFLGLLIVLSGGNYLMQNLPTSQVSNLSSPTATSQSLVSNPQLLITTLTTTPTKISTNTPVPPTITPTPTLGIGSMQISEKDGMTLVFVPAGEFTMGSNDDDLDERPIHQVYLDAYWIDQTEVTNGIYEGCVADGDCQPPSSEHNRFYGNALFDGYPVTFVSWHQANDYCEWAGRRLPTEAEWEKAARGTDGRTYPWGNAYPNSNLANYSGSGLRGPTEVGSYPQGASVYGAYDMAGNVWEWVSSLYKPYPYDANDGRESLTSANARVLRGGSWNNFGTFYTRPDTRVDSTNRRGSTPAGTRNDSDGFGFRCSRSE